MNSIDVTPSPYINFEVENYDKDCNFEVSDNVKISKYKNIL